MRYLQVSLIVIIVFSGILLVFSDPHPKVLKISLGVLLGVLILVFGASFLPGESKPKEAISPVIDDLGKIAQTAYKKTKKLVVLVVGGTVCLVGILMIALPGPAVVVIPAGLAILASEFVWARRLLKKAKEKIKEVSESNEKKKKP